MKSIRKTTEPELRLVEFLLATAPNVELSANWSENLLVRSMDDGEMGSFLLFPNGCENENRLFGRQVSEYAFMDEDGVEVFASLNLDNSGDLFEVDLWKADFSPLVRLSEVSEMNTNLQN